MRNPYFFNIVWLSATAVMIALALYGPCLNADWAFHFPAALENILLGIISAAILLILTEIINWIKDKTKYGFLKTKYVKQIITQVNEDRRRSDSIIPLEPTETSGIRYINGSIYHELTYYDCGNINYITELKYHYHGVYTGTVEYYDHSQSDWKSGKRIKTKAFITLNLNLANKMFGSGSYRYQNSDDFGKFEFQVADNNAERIIVSYINTIPSGLAEGYEIWA